MERAVPVLPVEDLAVAEEWGRRTFAVTDPFGNTIFVIGPLRPTQATTPTRPA